MTPQFSGSLASVDGLITLASEAKIPATDPGLLRGDGAFEVIRVYDGKPFAIERHLERLERSALNLRLALDVEAVRTDANRLLAHAGAGPDHELLRTEPLPEAPERIRLASVTYSPTRVLDGVKSLSYAANMLASRLARERGADEALLVTPHGRVLEAPTSSIFWVSDGQLKTPPLTEHILASITRALVIDQTGAVEQECTVEDLEAADEVFLASTVREVQPVASIDHHSFSSDSPLSMRIAQDVGARIQAELSAA